MIHSQKGTHDILPVESRKWQKAEKLLREIFQSYRYEEIRTPIFEKTTLFARGIGEFTDIVSKEMYTFTDKSGESLTLRPEYTASVVRSYIQHNWVQQGNLHRVWYMGPLFRQERPQKGRQRQFHQFGVECIGADGAQADAEVIAVAWKIYEKLGLKQLELKINSIGSPDARKAYLKILRSALEPHLDSFCPVCRDRFDGNTLRLFDCKNESCRELMTGHAPHITDHISAEDKQHFEELKSLLDAVSIPYTVDPSLVRGLDYYTRTTFEIQGKTLGAQDALCGGGRYDNLISDLGGKPTPSVGFAAGMERLIIAMEAEALFDDESESGPELYIAPIGESALAEGFRLTTLLRDHGIAVDLELLGRSPRAMLREANRKNAHYSLLLGDDEIRSGSYVLKNMRDGADISTDRGHILDSLRG